MKFGFCKALICTHFEIMISSGKINKNNIAFGKTTPITKLGNDKVLADSQFEIRNSSYEIKRNTANFVMVFLVSSLSFCNDLTNNLVEILSNSLMKLPFSMSHRM
jgi:hypothetical protein